jgi:UDPglucose 6-dehydrogenase
MRHPLIVDGRNFLDPAQVRAAGFAYEGIGRPSASTEIPPAIEAPAGRRLPQPGPDPGE